MKDAGIHQESRMRGPSDLIAYGALTTAAFVWGGSIVAQKIALDAFSAVETSLLRGIGALAILIPLWWWQEGPRTKFSTQDFMVLAALGMGVLGTIAIAPLRNPRQ